MPHQIPENCSSDIPSIALSAVQSISSIAQTILTVMGLSLTVLAVIGFVVIYRACAKAATKRADKKLKEYMDTPDFHNLLNGMISKGIEEKMRNTVFVNVHPELKHSSTEPSFKSVPGGIHDSQ